MKSIKLLFCLLFVFMATVLAAQVNKEDQDPKGEVYNTVEHQPEFPGGINALFKWIGENLIFPADAKEAGKEGKVFARFIIEKDGSISNTVIVKNDVTDGAGQAVLTMLNKMPKWSPGKQEGESVRVMYTMPVSFKLTENKK